MVTPQNTRIDLVVDNFVPFISSEPGFSNGATRVQFTGSQTSTFPEGGAASADADAPGDVSSGGDALQTSSDVTNSPAPASEEAIVFSGFPPEDAESDEHVMAHGKHSRGPRTPEWEAAQRQIALSDEHLMTHLPKNDYCEY